VAEAASLPLQRVLGSEMGQVFAELHRDHGVDLRLGTGIAEITGDGHHATGVRLSDGTRIDAAAVLIAVGAVPNTDLAEQAGLAVDDGVLVDAALRSSDPDIVAVGDIARAHHPLLNTPIRVEHWNTALTQPATAAATMLDEPAGYQELPYFFTDQYEIGMEYLGHIGPAGYEAVVVRGEPAGGKFLTFWTRKDRVLAGMSVNVWDVTDDIATLIRTGTPVDPGRLADPQVPLKSLTIGEPGAYAAEW
jgi:3-phenylpropionate/trans-cinnamate dioxygenase ferredoxin reductase subunit